MNHEESPGGDHFFNGAQEEPRLEAALRTALERKNPPPGFAHRVEKKLEQERERMFPRGRRWGRPERQWAVAAALALTFALPMGWRLHHQAEVARGEAAKHQVMLALRITGMQLRTIEARTRTMSGRMTEGETP